MYIVRRLKEKKGGLNCYAYLCKFLDEDVVVKICGQRNINKDIGKLIFSDYIHVKSIFEKLGIKVPKTKKICLDSESKADFIIIEEYCGVSLFEILYNPEVTLSDKVRYIKRCIKFIKIFPENIAIDTNPGNFVVNNRKEISFVDFIPPAQWKYVHKKQIQDQLKRIFPSMRSPDYRYKKDSYFMNKLRIKRLLFHCNKVCIGIDKLV